MAAPAVGAGIFAARLAGQRWARKRIFTRMVVRGASSTAARSGYRYRLAASGGAYKYNKSYKLYHTKNAGKLSGLKTAKSHGMPRGALAHISHGKLSRGRISVRTHHRYRREQQRTRINLHLRRNRRRSYA